MNRFFSRDSSLQVLQKIQKLSLSFIYDNEKHRVIISDEKGNNLVNFRLPIVFPSPEIITQPEKHKVNYVILLIQSGSCALGYFEDGNNLDHKVFKSYMVRMKQGVSQIKFLKTKGKSRAGSRVRLGETVEFFENINERLQSYFSHYKIHRIAISCSKILIPFLYNSKITTPFDKGDPRLFNIPKHIHTPNYDVLLDTHKFLLKGELIYEAENQIIVDLLLDEPKDDEQVE